MATLTFRSPFEDEPQSSSSSSSAEFQREWLEVQGILADYVQPESTLSLDDAISGVVQFWKVQLGWRHHVVLLVVDSLAEQIPYNHPSHKKLANFMLALHDSEKWIIQNDIDERRRQQHVFWNSFTDILVEHDWRPDRVIEEDYPDIWHANRSTFVANLDFPKQESERFLYMMAKDAFIDVAESDATYPVEVREARVIGAAQYIIHRATTIFEEVMKSCKRDAELLKSTHWYTYVFSRSLRYTGPNPKSTFFWYEWVSWKRVFCIIALDETYSMESREYAQKAADLMALQEKIADDRGATAAEEVGRCGRLTQLEHERLIHPRRFKRLSRKPVLTRY